MATPDRPRHCRTGVVKPSDRAAPLMLFAYTTPNGRLAAVVAAESIENAWERATGQCQANYDDFKAAGWRIWPCMVEWEERE